MTFWCFRSAAAVATATTDAGGVSISRAAHTAAACTPGFDPARAANVLVTAWAERAWIGAGTGTGTGTEEPPRLPPHAEASH